MLVRNANRIRQGMIALYTLGGPHPVQHIMTIDRIPRMEEPNAFFLYHRITTPGIPLS